MRSVGCRFVWCVPALVGSMWSCAECDREGCDALRRPAARESAGLVGVAGVVASASDVVNDGCQECPLGEATLQIFQEDFGFEVGLEWAESAARGAAAC